MSDLLREQLQSSLGAAYTIDRELGGGGMSRVFVAREEALDRDVVVKVLPPAQAEGVSAERFAREIRLAARLQEPHIVPVLAAGTTPEGLPYYTMPFVRGESLRRRLESPVPPGEAVAILRDVARALAYAHRQGVVHRDIKPENVLLSEGTAVVTDFGIAKALDVSRTKSPGGGLTEVGTSLGTPAYMAPEQAAGDGVDPRADLYAWGVMAYELLAGAHPFAGARSAREMVAAHISEAPAPLHKRAPQVPAPLAALVMCTLAKDPADRPSDAETLVRALEAPEVHAAGSRRPAARGWPRLAAVGAAIAVVAFLLVRRGGAPENAGVIAVMPFRVAAAEPGLAYLREGMLDLLSARLADRPRALDPRVVLSAWHRAGGNERTDPDPVRVRELARTLGAGRLLEGEVTGSAARLVLTARLLDTGGGEVRAQASATGASADLAALVDSVAARLVALDAGEQAATVSALAGVPLPALRAYLDGQRAVRAGEYQMAVDAYGRAVEQDSTFALAALRLSSAAGWVVNSGTSGTDARDLAMRHRDRLGARDRWMLPDADPAHVATSVAERVAYQERAVTEVPDNPELWYRLGDTYFHSGKHLGLPDVDRRAARAFERALALDSTFRPALEHLPTLYAWLGDSAAERRAWVLVDRDTLADYWPIWHLFAASSPEDRRRWLLALRRASPATQIFVGSVAPEVMEWSPELDSLRTLGEERVATAGERAFARGAGYVYALNRGQPSRAAALYEGSAATAVPAAALDAVFWDGDSAAAAPRIAAAERLAATPPPAGGDARQRWSYALLVAAESRLARGDTTGTVERIRRLRAAPPVDPGQPLARMQERVALLLDAHLAALTHRDDAGARVAALDSMLREGPDGTTLRHVGNLVVSRLWEERGDRQRAYDALWRTERGPGPTSYVSTYIRERARLAAALGHRDVAIEEYRRYLSARGDVEAPLRAHVASVRAELARLEAEGR